MSDKQKAYNQRRKQMRLRKLIKQNLWMALSAAMLLSTMVMIVSMVGDNRKAVKQEQNRVASEERYVAEIRGALKEAGYKNSGVSLTCVKDFGEVCEYTVTVHNDRLEKLDEEGRRKVLDKLRDIELPEGSGSGKILLYESHV